MTYTRVNAALVDELEGLEEVLDLSITEVAIGSCADAGKELGKSQKL